MRYSWWRRRWKTSHNSRMSSILHPFPISYPPATRHPNVATIFAVMKGFRGLNGIVLAMSMSILLLWSEPNFDPAKPLGGVDVMDFTCKIHTGAIWAKYVRFCLLLISVMIKKPSIRLEAWRSATCSREHQCPC